MSQRSYPSDRSKHDSSQRVPEPPAVTAYDRAADAQDPSSSAGAEATGSARRDSSGGGGGSGLAPGHLSPAANRDVTPDNITLAQSPASSSRNSQAPSRSIGMHTILNPPSSMPMEPSSRQSSREPMESPISTSSPSTHLRGTPSPSLPPTGLHYSRRILTPKSPAVRAASLGGRYNPVPGTIPTSQSLFLPPQNTSLNIESGSSTVPGRLSQPRQSMHPASVFHDPRAAKPPSHEGSPSTSHVSSYSPFSRASPGPPPLHMQQQQQQQRQSSPFSKSLPGPPLGTLSHGMTHPEAGGQYRGEGANYPMAAPQMTMDTSQGLIPVTIDMDSGSLKAKHRRQKNSCASKRFRQRKKAVEMEQTQTLKRLTDEAKLLTEERDFYRVERDFFRDLYSKMPGAHVPPRPASPTHTTRTRAISESEGEQPWTESEGRGGMGRSVRQRTDPGPVRLPYPTTPLHPGAYHHQPPAHPTPWHIQSSAPPQTSNPETHVSQQPTSQPPYSSHFTPREPALPPRTQH